MDEKLLIEILEDLKLRQERSNTPVPVGLSNRHAHLTKKISRPYSAPSDVTPASAGETPGQSTPAMSG